METLNTSLPPDIQSAVISQHGGPVAVSGQQGDHVVMTMAVFRDMMGVGSDDEFAKSVESLRISLAQAAVGQTLSLEEAAAKLAEKYGD
jgi:hypothetical protein